MRLRCRAATSTQEAGSRPQAAARPITLPSGTEAVGRHSDREWVSHHLLQIPLLAVRWRCWAATYMRGAGSPPLAGSQPPTLPSGTVTIGRLWVRGWTAVFQHWRCRAATYMRAAGSEWRVMFRSMVSPNGTGAVGRRSDPVSKSLT